MFIDHMQLISFERPFEEEGLPGTEDRARRALKRHQKLDEKTIDEQDAKMQRHRRLALKKRERRHLPKASCAACGKKLLNVLREEADDHEFCSDECSSKWALLGEESLWQDMPRIEVGDMVFFRAMSPVEVGGIPLIVEKIEVVDEGLPYTTTYFTVTPMRPEDAKIGSYRDADYYFEKLEGT